MGSIEAGEKNGMSDAIVYIFAAKVSDEFKIMGADEMSCPLYMNVR